jgi:hypothetical protein
MMADRMGDEPEPPEDPQVEILRRLTPEQKLRAAERLYWSVWELKAAWFRQEHPEWREEQVKKAVRDVFAWSELAILRELLRYREDHSGEHLRAIHEILRRRGDHIDRKELEVKLARFGLQQEWAAVDAR